MDGLVEGVAVVDLVGEAVRSELRHRRLGGVWSYPEWHMKKEK